MDIRQLLAHESVRISGNVEALRTIGRRACCSRAHERIDCPVTRQLFLAGVRYINYKHESIAFDDPYLSPILYKRKSFEHEREVRAFRFDGPVSALANNGGVMIERSKRNDLSGKSIQVSIGDLIEDIVVSPTAPPWLTIVLSKMLEKYSLSTKIRRSSLLDVPAF